MLQSYNQWFEEVVEEYANRLGCAPAESFVRVLRLTVPSFYDRGMGPCETVDKLLEIGVEINNTL